ncbi:MAG TPA: translation initiation factor IF-2 [Eubacteriales bacterium]|nr:translation initiation factor IF-2 [Eubacteriales bacterium]
MTDNSNNAQSFENLKKLKSNTAVNARRFQQDVAGLKQRLDEARKSADMKKTRFEEDIALSQTVNDTVTSTEVSQPPKTVVEKTEVVQVPKSEIKEEKSETKPIVKSDDHKHIAEQKPEPKSEQKPEQKAQKSAPTASNERTYKDEKGNIKVRRFLEPPQLPPKTSIAQQKQPYGKRPPQQQTGQRDNRDNTNNNQNRGPKRFDNRPQSQQRPPMGRPNMPMDKDKDAPQRTASKPPIKKTFGDIPATTNQPQKTFGNKNKTHEKSKEDRTFNKKALLTKTYTGVEDDERMIARRPRQTKKSGRVEQVIKKIEKAVITTEDVSLKVLSEKTGIPVASIIKQLFKEGIVKTINDTVEFSIAEYVASSFGVELEQKIDKTAEEIIVSGGEDNTLPDNTKRPPIVTVMGHVDHGKTSLLDAIRKTNVTSGEAGGITQHIGAYTVKINGEQITFIDTPGHAAFTAMRARGAKVTDVAIIVVAADDGVMPQTIEAINHAKAAEVSILVAINKMDKPTANIDKVKKELADQGLISEEWGGDIIMVPVSAVTRQGIDSLLESILLVTEIKDLKANPEKRATGTVIESKLDKGRGPVATILVQNGTLHVGDSIIAGTATGKIRAMFDDKGARVKSALPSCPVEVIGFSEVPDAGDFAYVADEKLVRKMADERKTKVKIENTKAMAAISLDELYGKINEGQLKNLNLVVKTDVMGSLEALKVSLTKIVSDEVKIAIKHGGVGAINESDVMLAKASQAIIIGFNVRPDNQAKTAAEREGVDIRLYNVIYDAVDDITKAMKGMLAPKFKETILGQVEVRETYRITGVGTVAGSYVTNGKITRNSRIRVYRDNVVVHDGFVLALKRFKDDAKEVAQGFECGVSLKDYNDIKPGDVFEAYTMEEIEQ